MEGNELIYKYHYTIVLVLKFDWLVLWSRPQSFRGDKRI